MKTAYKNRQSVWYRVSVLYLAQKGRNPMKKIVSLLIACLMLIALFVPAHALVAYPNGPLVNDNDSRVMYGGSWTYFYDASYGFYANDETFSNIPGNCAEYIFTGTGVKWIGAKSSNLGIAEVYIDGVKQAEIDQYAPTLQENLVLYSKEDLSTGKHTIKIVVTNRKNPDATDNHTTLDAFEYIDVVDDDPGEKINDRDPRVQYGGNWTYYYYAYSGFYADDETFSNVPGNWAEYTFTGTSVKWIGAKSTNLGIAEVYIDGVKQAEVDQYAPALQVNLVLYAKEDLPASEHTIRIVVTNRKNPAATDNHTTLDAFETVNAPDERKAVMASVGNYTQSSGTKFWGNTIYNIARYQVSSVTFVSLDNDYSTSDDFLTANPNWNGSPVLGAWDVTRLQGLRMVFKRWKRHL